MVIEQSDDEKQGKSLKEFDKTYRRTTATFWYTEESPVYKNLNEVLHIQNIDGVKPFASFIKYLNAQLGEEHSSFVKKQRKKVLYFKFTVVSSSVKTKLHVRNPIRETRSQSIRFFQRVQIEEKHLNSS
ncbi:unnamed protein product [Adineta ricciae]|uniref:Uncharacterized protein n=1 Tax=Adineta ricciae TaxID=249248 RepID=A0A815NIJ7_ADIRI|nr:unnamed protein product [Adineta ricciae]